MKKKTKRIIKAVIYVVAHMGAFMTALYLWRNDNTDIWHYLWFIACLLTIQMANSFYYICDNKDRMKEREIEHADFIFNIGKMYGEYSKKYEEEIADLKKENKALNNKISNLLDGIKAEQDGAEYE